MVRMVAILSILFLASCENDYLFIIQRHYRDGKRHADIDEVFSAKDDTSAFKEATRRLWLYKTLQRRSNRQNSRNVPEPSSFILKNEDSVIVDFPADVARKFVGRDIEHYKLNLEQEDKTLPADHTNKLLKVQ